MKQYFSIEIYDLVFCFKYFILCIVLQSRTSKYSLQELNDNALLFRVEEPQLSKENSPVFYKGVNALHTYGLGNAELMDRWNIEIVREFIGNLREQPISGGQFRLVTRYGITHCKILWIKIGSTEKLPFFALLVGLTKMENVLCLQV